MTTLNVKQVCSRKSSQAQFFLRSTRKRRENALWTAFVYMLHSIIIALENEPAKPRAKHCNHLSIATIIARGSYKISDESLFKAIRSVSSWLSDSNTRFISILSEEIDLTIQSTLAAIHVCDTKRKTATDKCLKHEINVLCFTVSY